MHHSYSNSNFWLMKHKHKWLTRNFFSFIFLIFSVISYAGGRDSTIVQNASSFHERINTNQSVAASSRTFAELDKYLSGQQFSFQQQSEFNKEYIDKANKTNPGIEEERLKAQAVLGEIDAANSYVDYLAPSDINQLPIGLKKKVGNTDVTIAISSAVFTPKYAELTVFARLKIPQAPHQIFFGVKGIKLSYKGGIIGDAKLVLLGDVTIPINGDNAALVLKGGFDMNTGQATDKTYITIDCNGFKNLGLTAAIEFPRSLMQPVDDKGKVVEGRVSASINNLIVSNWNDMITTVSFNKAFQVKGLNGIVFKVSNAAFDFSDHRNNPDIIYPLGYQQKYLQADNLTAWRGVYVKDLSVSLPPAFKDKTDSTNRVSFGVNDLVIDNNGITGQFYAQNILPITKGTASGWKFSVDSIRLAIEANHLLRAGFGGRIGLPVNNDYDTANKRKFLAYSAIITASSDYVCRVTTLDSIDFDLWKAKVLLKPNSYIQLTGNADVLKPEAMLHGKMGIVAKSTDEKTRPEGKNPVADLQGIEFEALHLTTTAPYVTARYFGYKGEVRVGSFPVSISDIALQSMPNEELALAFNLKVNLQESQSPGDTTQASEFSGRTRLNLVGKLNREQGIQSWKYERLRIEEIEIHANIKESFKIDGWVRFMDDDPVYGDGFAGSVKAAFTKGLDVKVDVNAVFGKTSYRYWYVDGKVDLGTGVGAPIKIQGFGGGAYYRMKKDGYDPAFSPTGIKYTPDSTAGLGVKAAVLFSVGDKKVAKGEASFEMAFNRGGGLRYIGFFGFAKVLSEINIPAGVESFVSGQLGKMEDKLKSMDAAVKGQLEQLKLTDPDEAAKQQSVTAERIDEGLSAYLGIQYDFNARTLHANFDLYINAAKGLLTGIGENYRAGWAVLHVEADKTWYLHAGTPTDPIGIRFGIGPIAVRTTSYFMAGHNIPAFPDPPQKVIDILRESGLQYTNNINISDAKAGRGIAFGAGISVSTGDIRALIFYANFSAGLGFDVMLKDFGNAHCEGSTERIGINGWYAQGQAYAYLQGELGVRVKLGFIKKNIAIIKGGAAALLQARLPNPTWVGGYLGFHVNILGGMIKGRFNMKFSFGNDCKITQEEGATEENLTIIQELTPENGATNVSILVNPKLKFTIAPDKILEAPKEDGSGNDYYKPQLDKFKIYKGTTEIPASMQYNEDGNELTLMPEAVFAPNTAYKVVAIVSFQQLVNGKWVALSDNGIRVEEKKEYSFTTGAAPDVIPHTMIKRLYPFFNQRNLYKDESKNGLIELNQDFSPFFQKFNKWKVRIENEQGGEIGTSYASTDGLRRFNFTLPGNLNTASTYKMLLLGEGPTDASSDVNKPGLELTFTTSRHTTLAAKIQSLLTTQSIVGRISSDVIDLQAQVNDYEGFELYELTGNQYTGNKPVIEGEINVEGEQYYNNFIKPLLYPNYPGPMRTPDGTIITIDDPAAQLYGVPPFKAITPSWYYVSALQSGVYSDYLRNRLPFVYNANKYYNLHFLELRKKIINKYLNQGGILVDPTQQSQVPPEFYKLVNEAFPFMLKGQYKAKLTFVQLDGMKGTSGEFIYENPIE